MRTRAELPCLLVQHRVDVALVVRDHGDPTVWNPSVILQNEELRKEKRAKHFECANPALGVSSLKGPGALLLRDLVVEPEDLFLLRVVQVGEPSTQEDSATVGGARITGSMPCRDWGKRGSLPALTLEHAQQQRGKQPNNHGWPARRLACLLPGPKGLKKRFGSGASSGRPLDATQHTSNASRLGWPLPF